MSKNIIIKLEEQLRQAMIDGDTMALDALISDKLMFTSPTGQIITKQMDLEGHSSGIQKLTVLNIKEQTIQEHETFFVVAVKADLEGTYAKIPIDGEYFYTRVWAKIDEHWQIVAGHVSKSI